MNRKVLIQQQLAKYEMRHIKGYILVAKIYHHDRQNNAWLFGRNTMQIKGYGYDSFESTDLTPYDSVDEMASSPEQIRISSGRLTSAKITPSRIEMKIADQDEFTLLEKEKSLVVVLSCRDYPALKILLGPVTNEEHSSISPHVAEICNNGLTAFDSYNHAVEAIERTRKDTEDIIQLSSFKLKRVRKS